MAIIVICLLTRIKSLSLKQVNNTSVNFPTQFCQGSISNGFGVTESREVSLKGSVHDFSIDYNAIDKSDMLNIYENLMVKDDIK